MISRVRICNFKSLRDVTVHLEPVTVLIGRSGTGKSNFVQALRFVRDYLVSPGNTVSALGGWDYVLCATRRGGADLSFEIEFEVPGIQGAFTYALAFEAQRKSLQRESLTLTGSSLAGAEDTTFFRQSGGHWVVPPANVNPPPAGQVGLGQLYGIPEVRMAHIVLTTGLGCYDFPGTVLTESGNAGKGSSSLADDASNYLRTYDGIATNLTEYTRLREMTDALRRLNASVTSVDLHADRSHLRVGHKVGDAKVLDFHLKQESEGFRRFLAHLLGLYQQPPKQTVIFEEPEKGIYPGALAVLADCFQAASSRTQVLLTSHSPELLKHFSAEQIRVVTMEGYDTQIDKVSQAQRDALDEHLLTADELLTVDPARIDSPAGS